MMILQVMFFGGLVGKLCYICLVYIIIYLIIVVDAIGGDVAI
jgi:hypothetical protein